MRAKRSWWKSWVVLGAVLLSIGGWGTTARGAIVDPNHINPLLDPATQPQFVTALPNPLIPAYVLTPDKVKYPGTDYYEVSARQITQQTGLIVEGTLGTTNTPLSTNFWGYGDSRVGATTGLHAYPGPTFEIRSNVPSKVRWLNELPATNLFPIDTTIGCGIAPSANCPKVAITTHVHGAHVTGDSDGGPLSWFSPGFAQTSPWWDPNTQYDTVTGLPGIYSYPNTQEAATVWYHDHAQRFTHTNVWAGLAGFYLIRDANEDALQLAGTLPKYPYEIPIAIQDRNFYPTGALAIPDQPVRNLLSPLCTVVGGIVDPLTCPVVTDPATGLPIPSITPELFGNIILANGRAWPFLNVEPRPYRLRLLNGCDSRTFILKFSDNRPFYQIGTDQGFLQAPVVQTQLIIMPGERFDVLVDFTGVANGTQIIMQNVGPEGPYNGLVPGSVGAPPAVNPLTVGRVMAFNVNQPLSATPVSTNPALITSLRATPIAPISQVGAVTRKLFLKELVDPYGRLTLTINGVGMMAAATELPALNGTEIWEIANLTPDAHPIHLHLVQFQVLDRTPFNTLTFVPPAMPGGAPTWTLTGPPVLPPVNEQGWKDTVQMFPGEVTRIIAKFDIAGGYVYHCHILSHEENDMMRPFIVVTPATAVTLTTTPVGPQNAGAALPVTFYAEGSTNLQALRSSDAFEYRFLVQAPGGALTQVQAYSMVKKLIWTPPSVPGIYTIRVEARAPGSIAAFEAFATTTYTLAGNLTGVVTNPATGLPVAGATVTANPGAVVTTTDAAGNYAFNLAVGTYTITVTGAGLGTATGTVTTTAAAVATLNTGVTAAANGILTGTITATGTLLPVAGVTVTATPAVGTAVTGVTDAAGNYTLAVPPGTYTITTSMLGYSSAVTAVPTTVVAGQTAAAVNVALTAGVNGMLTGTVTNAVGATPVAGAIVTANPGGFVGTTTATGTYSISVPPGTYTVTISTLGFGTGTGLATAITAGGTAASNVALTAAANGTLSGTITNATTALPVAGATVVANPGGFTAVTTATGTYTITVPPGSYTITTTAPGLSNTATVTPTAVAAGQAVAAVDVVAAPAANGTLSGLITDSVTGAGVAGAVVTANPGGYTATTNATGNYTLSVPAGTYTVTVSMLGYGAGTGPATVATGGTGTFSIALISATANGTLTGTVTGPGGAPAAGATVTANPGGYAAITNASGVYTISVPPGSYTVTTTLLGYTVNTGAAPVPVAPGQTVSAVDAALTAATNGTITGQVTSPVDGQNVGIDMSAGLANVIVTAEPGGFATMTDSMGYYTLTVPPGTYTVTATADGFYSTSGAALVPDAGTATVDLLLDIRAATGELEVSVDDAATGEGLAGATVVITPGDITGTTDESGDFYVQLEPGTYTVTVTQSGYTDATTSGDVTAGDASTLDVNLASRSSSGNNDSGGWCFISSLGPKSSEGGLGQAAVGLAGLVLAWAALSMVKGRK